MENNKKDFSEELNDAILAYKATPYEQTYCDLLCCVLSGIAEDAVIPVPADIDFDQLSVRPHLWETAKGESGLVALTEPDPERYPYSAGMKLRVVLRIILDDDMCSGILFNPEEYNEVLIRKDLLIHAIGAGLGILKEFGEGEEDGREEEQSLRFHRPIDEAAFEKIAEKIGALTGDAEAPLIMELIEDADELLFIRVRRRGDRCHVELGFDMSDFAWDHPLILGGELAIEAAGAVLHRFLVDGESTDDIEEIQTSFRAVRE